MVAINKGTAAKTFHVVSKQNDTFVIDQGKVVVGAANTSNGLLSIKNPTEKLFEVSFEDDESNPFQAFYVSGALDNFNYGSDLTGSVFINSGSAHLGDSLFMGGGPIIEYVQATDEDAQNVSLTAAEFKQGLVVHTSTGGSGTVTMDTAANLISTLELTADNMTAHCYYINDGNQDVAFSGAASGVTYANTSAKVKQNQGAQVLVRRTGAAAVTVYLIGSS